MILDVRGGALPTDMAGDVVVIGSGAAGIVTALELAKAGLAVIVIEAGGSKFSAASQEFYRAQQLSSAFHTPGQMYRRRMFGGTTTIWGGRCIPFDPIDFADRPWMAHAKWPIDHADIAPFYAPALDYALAGPEAFSAGAALPGETADMFPGIAADTVRLDRIERFSLPLDFGAHYRRRLAENPRIRVMLNAPVVEILTDAAGNAARGVRIAHANGSRQDIAAPRVIVACGGLETPRLLLASTSARPCGLGNARDLVGRFYQCHIEGHIGLLRLAEGADEARIDYSRTAEGVYVRRYIWLSPEAQRANQLAGLVLRPDHVNIVDPAHRNPVLSAMYLAKGAIISEYARKLTATERAGEAGLGQSRAALYAGHLRNITLGAPLLAGFSAKWLRRRILARRKLPSVVLIEPSRSYQLNINAEQEPNPASRVRLGDERDALGMRRIVVDWASTGGDFDRLERGLRLVEQAFAGSGAARIDFSGIDLAAAVRANIPIGGHHIGTARMGATASDGVCDGNAELFGTRGVYIAGAAAFATSGFANPTLTLIAQSLRLADHIAGAWRAAG